MRWPGPRTRQPDLRFVCLVAHEAMGFLRSGRTVTIPLVMLQGQSSNYGLGHVTWKDEFISLCSQEFISTSCTFWITDLSLLAWTVLPSFVFSNLDPAASHDKVKSSFVSSTQPRHLFPCPPSRGIVTRTAFQALSIHSPATARPVATCSCGYVPTALKCSFLKDKLRWSVWPCQHTCSR